MNRQQRRSNKKSAFNKSYMSKFANRSMDELHEAQKKWALDRGLHWFAEMLNDPEMCKRALDNQRKLHQEACDILNTMGIEASLADELKINCPYEHQQTLHKVLASVFESHGIPTNQISGLDNYLR